MEVENWEFKQCSESYDLIDLNGYNYYISKDIISVCVCLII